MNKEELQAIKDRLSKITPPPWSAQGNDWGETEIHVGKTPSSCIIECDNIFDGMFIASAPQDIAKLIEHVEYLEKVLERSIKDIKNRR